MEQASFLEADGLTPINEQKDACADQTLIWADSDYIGQARSWKQGGFQFIKWTAEGAQNGFISVCCNARNCVSVQGCAGTSQRAQLRL